MSTDDEILYGGGQSVPVGTPDAKNVISDMFFIAENAILSNQFEMMTTQPTTPDEGGDPVVMFVLTFKGRTNGQKNLAACTVVLSPQAAITLAASIRQKWVQVPIQFRGE